MFDSSGSDVLWRGDLHACAGTPSSSALNALPHDGPSAAVRIAHAVGLRPDARVESAAAVEAALRVRVVEVVQDARDLHALVLVQLVLEHAGARPL